MNKSETLVTLDTHDTGRRKKNRNNTTTQKAEKMSNMNPPKTVSGPRCSQRVSKTISHDKVHSHKTYDVTNKLQ
jgi:hypothetical protein